MTRKFDPALLPPAPDLAIETGLWAVGAATVGGIDEAGRGALAGPVTAAVLVLPTDPEIGRRLAGLRDSKALPPGQRRHWAERLALEARDFAVGSAGPDEIDSMGIIPATRLAAQRALDGLNASPDHLILDYLFLPENPLPQTSLTKGDARCLSIAGASVLAKVHRDEAMRRLGDLYPGYGLASHKGYGTERHRAAIEAFGPSPAHRLSFAPLANAADGHGR